MTQHLPFPTEIFHELARQFDRIPLDAIDAGYPEIFHLRQQVMQPMAKPDAIVMHPGPMNRGVEIDSAVADGKQSVILPQVTFGIAVRMAVMSILAGN